MFAAVGSAVGLVNIWRFPYIVGQNGGAAFIALYIFCLILIGFPVLVSEILIGRTGQRDVADSLGTIAGKKPLWMQTGKGIMLTGFIVSSFYSVVAGWIIGYLVYAIRGVLSTVSYEASVHNPLFAVGYHAIFMILAMFVLNRGIQKGIEWANKFMMPTLVILLLFLMGYGLTLPGASEGVRFLFYPNWSALTPMAFLTALGHAFFTLSLGQGTMITYGSYIKKSENIPNSCIPIVVSDTVISLLAGIAILTIVFAGGQNPDSGIGLIFYTLPTIFAKIPGGYFMAIGFFFLVLLAAITSQTSAMEPIISYLIDKRNIGRHKAVFLVGISAFLLGIPSALSVFFFNKISFIAMDILIPLGGLAAVLFVGWVWGVEKAFPNLYGREPVKRSHRALQLYLKVCVKWLAPVLIAIIFISSIAT